MTISTGLLYSLLALDSCNCGNDLGVSGLGEASNGSAAVGGASIPFNLADANTEAEATAASFYVVAHQTDAGIVISYRGTDNPLVDWHTGWNIGAGESR
ncbi:hypothetical protein OEW28_13050 [Defluviimonas sp. WL0002]|uniref:Uncharacterized protein n=1 Tax=Albidovulum marisflavi TaxID=2984159 RepID=A0ABT2ZEP4_9RHOB|nr:hypothetical protein [Defluviimonas sp. WL0002]MCV2869556.1 hypothetical protein [Defluviimonas sp. WL0002]